MTLGYDVIVSFDRKGILGRMVSVLLSAQKVCLSSKNLDTWEALDCYASYWQLLGVAHLQTYTICWLAFIIESLDLIVFLRQGRTCPRKIELQSFVLCYLVSGSDIYSNYVSSYFHWFFYVFLLPDSNVLSLQLIHREISNDQWAMSGITHLGNNIYILSPSSNSIFVHQDQEPFQKLREIQTKAIKSPVDIASCQKSTCLYVTDEKSSCLWKVTPSQNDQIIKCLDGIGEPYTLSVSCDGCVLMTRCGSPSKLETYYPDTNTVGSIELPEEVDGPQHAVRTSTGNFIVSYGKRDRKIWSLMEVSASGQVIRRHDSKKTFQQLNGSYHLAVDVNDRVIVVDFYNNRVMLLDSKLNWARTLLTKDRHGIHSPKRLCFVRPNNQLIVKNRKTVDVYSFRCSKSHKWCWK